MIMGNEYYQTEPNDKYDTIVLTVVHKEFLRTNLRKMLFQKRKHCMMLKES